MLDALRRALEAEPDVANALLFGSRARGSERPDSDADVAVELVAGAPRDVRALGGLAARLEAATGHLIGLVLLDEAPPPLAYRVFREGRLLVERDHAALVARKSRAILDYLDFKPAEDLCAAGVLRAAVRREQAEFTRCVSESTLRTAPSEPL
jgi:predicted nucleotidyltransferase